MPGDNWLLYAALGCFGICAALIALLVHLSAEQGRAFFEECRQHRPNYECQAMWNGSQPQMPIIVPMPIPMGR